MALSSNDALELVRDTLWKPFQDERDKLDRIDKWYRWDHDAPHQPRQATSEYKQLRDRAQTPWLGLVVTSVAQALYVDGYRQADSPDDADPWGWWQANGMDARQIPVHRAALAYGHSYVSVLPGADELTGDEMPEMRGHSPRRMLAFYKEPEHDAWPMYALRADPQKFKDGSRGWHVRLYDDEVVWHFSVEGGTGWKYLEYREHKLGVCPVVRFANQLDLEGRTPGEIEPLIPIAGRIDQTVFDRLVVQRFSSWVVRTIAGMTKPDTDEEAAAEKLRLRVEDILVADDPDTKFGSLPATPLDGFIKAAEEDISVLAAVSQTPVYELVGDLINLSAEALEAARASFSAKVDERKTSFGESWEQVLRLSAWVMGDKAGAQDHLSQARWRNTRIRSLSQAADALGKLAKMVGVPVEMLFEHIPDWTQQDVERAKALLAAGGSQPPPDEPPAE